MDAKKMPLQIMKRCNMLNTMKSGRLAITLILMKVEAVLGDLINERNNLKGISL